MELGVSLRRPFLRLRHRVPLCLSSTQAANLSKVDEASAAIRKALWEGERGAAERGAPILFVLEALLIYLEPSAAKELLATCAAEAREAGAAEAALAFADRLPEVAGCDAAEAQAMLSSAGWELDVNSWLPKPGLARHMGIATLSADRK